MIAAEHVPAVMQCQILGVPPPVISWTFNGHSVHDVSDRHILSSGSLYFAAPLNRSYAGQYVCNGTNSEGSVSSGAVLFRVACKYHHHHPHHHLRFIWQHFWAATNQRKSTSKPLLIEYHNIVLKMTIFLCLFVFIISF